MDVVKNCFFIPHSPRKNSNVLRRFAEFNVRRSSSRKYVGIASAKFSSSTDIPSEEFLLKKRIKSGSLQEGKKLNEIGLELSKDFKKHDVILGELGRLDKKQRRGHLVWKELQKLARKDTEPPRWIAYKGAEIQPENAPLFLCLPDIISNGLSLSLHEEKLAKLFEVRRLHVPVSDTSTNGDLITLIEAMIREESSVRTGRPIYMLGEGYGASLAISVAARISELDLVLILVDPATWCDKGDILPPGVAVMDAAPGPVSSSFPLLFSMSVGDPVTITKAIVDFSLPLEFVLKFRDVLQVIASASMNWSKDTVPRKVNQLQLAAHDAVSQMGRVKADVLVLFSGKTQNEKEAKRFRECMPSAIDRNFPDRRGALLLEDGVELASLIKASNMYRRSKPRDIITDYIPPTEEEIEAFRKAHLDFMKQLFSPVYFHVQENGSVRRGLPRLTKERPILLVCNHTFVGFDLGILMGSFMESQNVTIRALAHPLLTADRPGGIVAFNYLPDLARLLGSVPTSGRNLYKLLAAKETVLLLPGGMREAVKRKEEKYTLIWPHKPEFVRTAIRHGAVIIPMAAVGGDEFIKVVLDQHQILSLPIIGEHLERLGNQMPRARHGQEGADDEGHMLGSVGIPTPPPRMYFIYQKPIFTHELRDSLNDKQVVEALYTQVKMEIEAGLSYLLKMRNEDVYRDFVPRILYEKIWSKQAPTFIP